MPVPYRTTLTGPGLGQQADIFLGPVDGHEALAGCILHSPTVEPRRGLSRRVAADILRRRGLCFRRIGRTDPLLESCESGAILEWASSVSVDAGDQWPVSRV